MGNNPIGRAAVRVQDELAQFGYHVSATVAMQVADAALGGAPSVPGGAGATNVEALVKILDMREWWEGDVYTLARHLDGQGVAAMSGDLEAEVERLNAVLRIANDSVGLTTDAQLKAFLSQSMSANSPAGGAPSTDAMHLALRVFDKASNEGWAAVTEEEFGKAQQALYDVIYHVRPNA